MPRKKTMGRAANGNGTIRKKTVTKNGTEYTSWEGRVTVGYDPGTGKQIQKSVSGKTQKEVRQKLSKIIVELDEGTYQAPCKLTVKEWLESWLTNYLGNVKPSTALLYRQQAELYIIPKLGALKVEALTSDQVQKFYNELFRSKEDGGKGLSAKTVKNVHGVFHKALEQAKKNHILRFNPSDACELPRIYKQEIKPLNREQAGAFLREIQGHTHEYLFCIALFTGMRQGELLGLAWDSVDLEQGTLTVKRQLCREKKKGGDYYFSPPKNNKNRVLSLAPSVVRWFRWQKLKQNGDRLNAGEAWEETGLVFTNPSGGVLSYRTVYDCFKRVMKKLNLPDVRFHDLRHTYAVFALQKDDIKTVQEHMGHATAAFTLDIYGHVLDEMKHASASHTEELIQSFSTEQAGPGSAVSNA